MDVGLTGALHLVGLEDLELEKLDRGVSGYAVGVRAGEARLYWHPEQPSMGLHFVLSGEACRELEHRHGVEVWRQLHAKVVDEGGGKFTRVDLAIDDRTGELDLTRVEACARDWDNQVRSRWKAETGGPMQRGWRADAAKTLYFGSRTSSMMCRMYDKAAQRGEAGIWARVELELKGSKGRVATWAMQLLRDGMDVGEVVASILRGHLAFVEPDAADTNKSRWALASWWSTWLRQVRELPTCAAPRVVKTAEEVKEWLKKQAAPSLAALWSICKQTGQSWHGLMGDLLQDGERRQRERHRLMVAQAVAYA